MASTIEDIIAEITEYIDSCKPQMFSGSNIVVNRDDMDNLLDELKRATPIEIERYQKIISNQEQILANAQSKADAIIAQAQIKTDELISEHEIMQQAYAQANEVVMIATKQAQDTIDKATKEANEIRASAMAYTDDMLKAIQEILVKSMDTTRRNADSYLNTMQGYLDIVTKNRLEINPNIEAAIPNQKVN
ncbi:MAG: ATPase, partial [Lachnospiraceae bacterium]|nr:ATPase [Lachnospiraceae bacterium]